MNDTDISRVLSELRRIAAAANTETVQPDRQAGNINFTELLGNSLQKVNQTQARAGELAHAFELGDPRVNLAEVMVNAQKANIAFTALTNVRNRVVEAYREVMSMQV